MAVEPERLLTYEDYVAFPDDGIRREIVQGKAHELPAPSVRHQRVVGHLYYLLRAHLEAHGGGEVFVSPIDVRLGPNDIVQPDIVFVGDDRRDVVGERHLDGAPSLVVEVVSDPRHDRVRKRALYARSGVLEYWIVDPDADRVEVHRRAGDVYSKPVIYESGETVDTPLLPGLQIEPAALFSH